MLVKAFPTPLKEMMLLSVLTSLNRAELLGLRWGRVNLSNRPVIADGENLPRFALAVRENYYLGQFGSVKCKQRERLVPLASVVIQALQGIKDQCQWTEPGDLVFVGPRRGKPVDARNLESRVMKPIAKKLGMSWVSWHVFRRTFATLADQAQWEIADRIAAMGHSNVKMTMHYTSKDLDRRRASVERLSEQLDGVLIPDGRGSRTEGQAEGMPSKGASAGSSALDDGWSDVLAMY
jgi:integrase